jgi:Uma2 family endonuclease
MVRAIPQPLTFEAFLELYPEDGGRYELIDGVMIAVNPTGQHEEVTAFVAGQVFLEITRLQLPYFLPRTCTIKPNSPRSGYKPDLVMLDQGKLSAETLWKKASTVVDGSSAPWVMEVVSTNWRDDYLTKLRDYEEMGIPEYWIVDYLALGGQRYIGSPKQPTISIYQLADEEYQLRQFRGGDRVISGLFPELCLTAEKILSVGQEF